MNTPLLKQIAMTLGIEENPIVWEENLKTSIKNLADLELQKQIWVGKHPELISSFSEVLASIYDDFDFSRFIRYYESENGKNHLSILFHELDKMIIEYQDYGYELEAKEGGHDVILKDSRWLDITNKAQEVINTWNTDYKQSF